MVIGAGKSSPVLIDYLLKHAPANNWQVIVGDISLEVAQARIGDAASGRAIELDISSEEKRKQAVSGADIVISMLPAWMHFLVACDCLEFGKDLITASYVSSEDRKSVV